MLVEAVHLQLLNTWAFSTAVASKIDPVLKTLISVGPTLAILAWTCELPNGSSLTDSGESRFATLTTIADTEALRIHVKRMNLIVAFCIRLLQDEAKLLIQLLTTDMMITTAPRGSRLYKGLLRYGVPDICECLHLRCYAREAQFSPRELGW